MPEYLQPAPMNPVNSAAMPPAPIGVYDSGVGGLFVLRALQAALPNESFIYVADSGYAPYGDRERDFLQSRAQEILTLLVQRGVKAIVLACNTISIAAVRFLRERFDLPIVAMEPAIKPAAKLTQSGTVLVMATTYTVQSPAVASLCEQFAQDRRVLLQACPGLADQIERGDFDSPATLAMIRRYLEPGLAAGADTIVLGCTHYSFVRKQIAQLAGPHVTLVDPVDAIVRQLQRRIEGMRADPAAAVARTLFLTSGDAGQLRNFLLTLDEVDVQIQPL